MVQGVSALMWSKSPLFRLVAMPLDSLLAIGIGMDGYERYLGTKNGEAHFIKHAYILCPAPGQVLYLPPGFLYHPIAYEEPKGGQRFHPEVHLYTHLPLSGSVMNDADIDDRVLSAVRSHNNEVFGTKATPMWKLRAAWFKEVFGA
jgi:hypothetical protein